jgi:hypothetical protein
MKRWPLVSNRERAVPTDPRQPRTPAEIAALAFIGFLVVIAVVLLLGLFNAGDYAPVPS